MKSSNGVVNHFTYSSMNRWVASIVPNSQYRRTATPLAYDQGIFDDILKDMIQNSLDTYWYNILLMDIAHKTGETHREYLHFHKSCTVLKDWSIETVSYSRHFSSSKFPKWYAYRKKLIFVSTLFSEICVFNRSPVNCEVSMFVKRSTLNGNKLFSNMNHATLISAIENNCMELLIDIGLCLRIESPH